MVSTRALKISTLEPCMRRNRLFWLCLILCTTAWSQSKPSLERLKTEALQNIDAKQAFTQQMVDEIFSYSELGFQEVETSRYVTDILEKNGFKVEHGVAGIPTAWVATYGG